MPASVGYLVIDTTNHPSAPQAREAPHLGVAAGG
jgi:hypothetical protein